MRPKFRIALALVAAAASVAVGVPAAAQAAPVLNAAATVGGAAQSAAATDQVLADRGRDRDRVRHRRFGGFGFPIVTPFFTGGFGGLGFGFDGGFSRGGGCDIFLAVGDLNSYILCRVG